MATKKKMLQAAAGNAGGAGPDITDVFSTYLYDGTDGTQSIVNGVDLSNEGGLVWVKNRGFTAGGTTGITDSHQLFDTERGVGTRLLSNTTSAALSATNYFSSFNSDGFTVGQNINNGFDGGHRYASWTFRKAPKFFDVVTYTGDGVQGRDISHNLGVAPGMVIVKRTDSSDNWAVQHRSLGGSKYLRLNSTTEALTNAYWDSTDADSTVFRVGSNGEVNASGGTYVAYLFAHNDGDGGFGPDGDQDIIKCGSYTGTASEVATIDLGFEAQWVLIKRADSANDWYMADMMRGAPEMGDIQPVSSSFSTQRLRANTSAAESADPLICPTPNGFKFNNQWGASTWVYIAIRRGPLAPPESGTEVFDSFAIAGGGLNSSGPAYNFADMVFSARRDVAYAKRFVDRVRGVPQVGATGYYLDSTSTAAEASYTGSLAAGASTQNTFASVNNAFYAALGGSNGGVSYAFKRAPGFFDVVAYTGDGTAGRTVSHNLGVAPEMIWVKSRGAARLWAVYNSASGPTKWLRIDSTNAETTSNIMWNDTSPTDSVFSVGSSTAVNNSGENYIAYLFASLPGISKVGSVSHTNGTDTNVDCGFSSGARFILIKRTDGASSWYVFDTERGIVAGDDKALYLQSTLAEQTADWIDPYSSGFTMVGASFDSGTYIFYAIA